MLERRIGMKESITASIHVDIIFRKSTYTHTRNIVPANCSEHITGGSFIPQPALEYLRSIYKQHR